MARAPATLEIEALPEADRLGEFPHPRNTAVLYGHAKAEAMFSDALASDRTHHAWLLSGPRGIGKATLAYKVARAALARPDERDLFGDGLAVASGGPTDRQVRALSHPSLLVIRRPWDAKNKRFPQVISVDEVRRLKGFLALSAGDNSRRVVIVDSADELNVNSANALLKSLEEPPARTIFLIVTSAPGRLLPTIRSRCRVLPLAPLSDDDLTRAAIQALAAAGKTEPQPESWISLLPLAEGSAGRALALIEGGGLALQSRIDRILSALPKLDVKAVHTLADEMSGAAQDAKFQLFFDLLQATLARLVAAQSTGRGRPADVAHAGKLIGADRLASFAELWETLARDKAETMSLNLDRKSLIIQSFVRLEAVSRG